MPAGSIARSTSAPERSATRKVCTIWTTGRFANDPWLTHALNDQRNHIDSKRRCYLTKVRTVIDSLAVRKAPSFGLAHDTVPKGVTSSA